MKYIRTEDGIYDGEKYNADYLLDMGLDKIVKQADTIEELCDEIVLKHYAEDHPAMYHRYSVRCLEFAKIEAKKWLPEKYEIYGAIWTSKGLIYVAKLNSKGELELI